MPLVSWEDFQRPAATDMNRKVYELVRTRVTDMQNPMPPLSAGTLDAKDIALLSAWSERGAPRASASDPICKDMPDAGSTSAPVTGPPPSANQKDATCYDLTVHGASVAGDTTPFMIPTGETYHCFYFAAPWPQPALSVAFRSKLNTAQALHHWFLYAMPSATANGTVETCLPLHVDGPKMIAGWAPGGKDMAMPEGVGAELVAPGSTLMLEWHYFNNTNAEISDKSSVTICTVPVGSRPNVAAITWLGTENFGLGMPAHAMSSFTGTCQPSRTGLGPSDPIHLLYTIPHMHQFGRHMKVEIKRAGGNVTVFDQPFSEKNQAFVATPGDVLAGDTLLTTCSYENTSDSAVGYGGPFDNAEMCYAFVLGYPAHALDNGTRSLLGASNSCL